MSQNPITTISIHLTLYYILGKNLNIQCLMSTNEILKIFNKPLSQLAPLCCFFLNCNINKLITIQRHLRQTLGLNVHKRKTIVHCQNYKY